MIIFASIILWYIHFHLGISFAALALRMAIATILLSLFISMVFSSLPLLYPPLFALLAIACNTYLSIIWWYISLLKIFHIYATYYFRYFHIWVTHYTSTHFLFHITNIIFILLLSLFSLHIVAAALHFTWQITASATFADRHFNILVTIFISFMLRNT